MAADDAIGASPARVGTVGPERVVTDAIAEGHGLVVAVGADPALRLACADTVARARLSAGDDVVVLAAGADGLTDAVLAEAFGLDANAVPAALFDLPDLYATAGLRLVAIVRDAQRLNPGNLAGLRELAALRSRALSVLLVGDDGLVPIADALMAVGLCFVRLDPEPAAADDDGGYVWAEAAATPAATDGPDAPYAYHPVDISFSPVLPDWIAPDVPTLIPAAEGMAEAGASASEPVPAGALAPTGAVDADAGAEGAPVWDEPTAEQPAAEAPVTWPGESAVVEADDSGGIWPVEATGDAGAAETEGLRAPVPEIVDAPAAHEWPEASEPYALDDPLPDGAGGDEEGRRFDEYSSAFAYLAAQEAHAGRDDAPTEDEGASDVMGPAPVVAPAGRGRSRVRWFATAVVAAAVLGTGWLVIGRKMPDHPASAPAPVASLADTSTSRLPPAAPAAVPPAARSGDATP
ncbi:hypothetical protein, partial [Acidisphaera rubrifaciens]|uniref:hypothetical protein n=1 Tax=Acidisphaera rubrifaciens TaxID=50715 RepID=UPI0011DD2BE6